MARLGRVIRRRRVLAKLGQEEFASRANMHRTTCSLIERGLQSPTVVMLARMAAALETSMASLLKEAEKKGRLPEDPPTLPSGRRPGKKRGA